MTWVQGTSVPETPVAATTVADFLTSGSPLLAVICSDGSEWFATPGTTMTWQRGTALPGTSAEPVATTVVVTPDTFTLSKGATVTLSAVVNDQFGAAMPSAPVTWSATPSTVATITSGGVVSGVGVGSFTVTATSGSATWTSITLHVAPVAPALVTVGTQGWDDTNQKATFPLTITAASDYTTNPPDAYRVYYNGTQVGTDITYVAGATQATTAGLDPYYAAIATGTPDPTLVTRADNVVVVAVQSGVESAPATVTASQVADGYSGSAISGSATQSDDFTSYANDAALRATTGGSKYASGGSGMSLDTTLTYRGHQTARASSQQLWQTKNFASNISDFSAKVPLRFLASDGTGYVVGTGKKVDFLTLNLTGTNISSGGNSSIRFGIFQGSWYAGWNITGSLTPAPTVTGGTSGAAIATVGSVLNDGRFFDMYVRAIWNSSAKTLTFKMYGAISGHPPKRIGSPIVFDFSVSTGDNLAIQSLQFLNFISATGTTTQYVWLGDWEYGSGDIYNLDSISSTWSAPSNPNPTPLGTIRISAKDYLDGIRTPTQADTAFRSDISSGISTFSGTSVGKGTNTTGAAKFSDGDKADLITLTSAVTDPDGDPVFRLDFPAASGACCILRATMPRTLKGIWLRRFFRFDPGGSGGITAFQTDGDPSVSPTVAHAYKLGTFVNFVGSTGNATNPSWSTRFGTEITNSTDYVHLPWCSVTIAGNATKVSTQTTVSGNVYADASSDFTNGDWIEQITLSEPYSATRYRAHYWYRRWTLSGSTWTPGSVTLAMDAYVDLDSGYTQIPQYGGTYNLTGENYNRVRTSSQVIRMYVGKLYLADPAEQSDPWGVR